MKRFVKAHACGNDFLIVEGELAPDLAVRLCARNTGLGADGVEFLQWTGERSGRIRLANADGSIAEISGNGTRCVAAWMAYRQRLEPGETVRLETDAGPRECTVMDVEGHRFWISSGMGEPKLLRRQVRLADGTEVDGVEVSMGNPHFVIFTEQKTFASHGREWQELGQEICFHRDFTEQTNVEFVRVSSTNTLEIRIFERGVGPTTSSGTGTSASAAATIFEHHGRARLLVKAPGGEQQVDWRGPGSELVLTGPAELIAEGEAW
ncbi:MAG TPA: diaminopimelate epimerase [Silvibacterium sp.]|nr:diaminopimelate epimerase [Silvibacterium sp.]